jgi:hypothetical protein
VCEGCFPNTRSWPPELTELHVSLYLGARVSDENLGQKSQLDALTIRMNKSVLICSVFPSTGLILIWLLYIEKATDE